MDKATLDQILTTALATQPFKVTGGELASSSITSLLAGYLGGDALVLEGASSLPSPPAGETVIAGTLAGTFFGLSGLKAEAHFSVVGGNAEVVIHLANIASGWKPSSSFPTLKGGYSDSFTYSGVTITLDSLNANGLPAGFQAAYGLPLNSAALEKKVARGMSFKGTAAVQTGAVGDWILKQLIGDQTFAVTCPIELVGDIPRMRMTIAGTVAFTVANFSFPITLEYVVAYLETEKPPLAITDLVHLGGTITKTIGERSLSIPVGAQYSGSSPGQIVFLSNLAAGLSLTLADIPDLIAGASISDQIPADFPALSSIALHALEFTLAVSGRSLKLSGISATIGYADGKTAWKPFGSLVSFHDMAVTFSRSSGGGGLRTFVAASADVAGGTLDASVQLPAKTFEVVLSSGTQLDVAGIVNEIVANSITMPKILCTAFRMNGDPAGGSYELNAVVENNWSFSNALVLKSIGFDIRRDTVAKATTGQLVGSFTVAGAELMMRGDYANGGWTFHGGMPADGSISVRTLIAEAATLFGLTLPTSVPAITISNIAMMFQPATRNFSFSCAATMTILEQNVRITLQVSNTNASGARATLFQGVITIGGVPFVIDFTSGSADKKITASWNGTGGPLDFGAVARYFGLDLAGVPAELIPRVTSASFTYDFTTKTLVLTAMTEKTKTVLVSTLPASSSTRVSGALLGIDVSVSLTDLPIVGEKLAAVENMGITGVQLMVTSAALTADQVATLNALIPSAPKGLPTFPAQALDKGLMLSIPFQFGGKPQPPLAIRYSAAKQAILLAVATASPAVPSVAWLNVQRSFGPVNIKRVGVGYQDGVVLLAIDAGFTISAVSIELMGLSLGFTLEAPPSITPALQGMNIRYQGGPLTISGGFLDVLRDGRHEYNGMALISAESFTISAIGSYATVEGAASLFIFAMLSAPLGGPSFFFVTGLAAGFGINRALTMPTLDDLPSFPLVAAAMAGETGKNPFAGMESDPAAALKVMSEYIPPAYGANWLALGVRFTSFEMIQSFALITVAFGTSFEVSLLGLSAITIPTNAPNPIAYAELALSVTFSPDKGVLAVMGKLTPQSYIFDEACHLTGGFAFYTWLTDNNIDGAPAGEFVITLGGYHPAFKAPSYYPQVPRVGANWQVSPNLMVKGGYYFALTPTCVMAGGSLEAVWQSGDLKAWFNAHADFLLSWKPFHYSASIGLSLGASYKVNLLFTSFTVTVHLGVQLDLWGPEFAGRATVDLSVISFTISFGRSAPSIEPISWDDFKTSFLPNVNAQGMRFKSLPQETMPTGDKEPIPTDSYCYIRVADGLVKDLTNGGVAANGPDWVINPEEFQLITHSAIPCSEATLATSRGNANDALLKSTALSAEGTANTFGVGPVGVADGNLISKHVITVLKLGAGDSVDNGYDFSQHVKLTPSVGNAPKSAWSASTALNPDFKSINNSSSVIPSTLNGFVITANAPVPDKTVAVDISTLLATLDPTQPTFSWATPTIPTTDTFNQDQAMATLMSTINTSSATTMRASIVSALAAHSLTLDSAIDVTRMAASAANVLLSKPVLSLLGEEKAG